LLRKQLEEENKISFDEWLEYEALWVYRYMKHTGQDIGVDYPSAKIQAFKSLCLKEGDYQVKEQDKTEDKEQNMKGMYDGR
jgi:hypothetical protein